ERALVARERVAGLAELELRRVDQLADRRQAFVQFDEPRDLGLRARQSAQQRELGVAVQAFGEGATALEKLARVGEAAVALLQRFQLLGRKRVAIELFELVAQPLDALAVVGSAAEFVDARAGL